MKDILVIACGPFDSGTLQRKSFTDRYRFHFEEISTHPRDIALFISYITDKYSNGNIAGVIGTHDGPESLVAAILSMEMGLPGIDSVKAFTCEHKYYSRQAQKAAVRSAVPEIQALAIDSIEPEDVRLADPFIVKPVKSAFSILARPIENFETLKAFLPKSKSAWQSRFRPSMC